MARINPRQPNNKTGKSGRSTFLLDSDRHEAQGVPSVRSFGRKRGSHQQ
jgi:hypothetical protein